MRAVIALLSIVHGWAQSVCDTRCDGTVFSCPEFWSPRPNEDCSSVSCIFSECDKCCCDYPCNSPDGNCCDSWPNECCYDEDKGHKSCVVQCEEGESGVCYCGPYNKCGCGPGQYCFNSISCLNFAPPPPPPDISVEDISVEAFGIGGGAVAFLAILAFVCCMYRRRQRRRAASSLTSGLLPADSAASSEQVPTQDEAVEPGLQPHWPHSEAVAEGEPSTAAEDQ